MSSQLPPSSTALVNPVAAASAGINTVMDTPPDSSPAVIDLLGLKLQPHVEEALLTAQTLARDQPINAATALRAAAIVNQKVQSNAFRFLASMLPDLTKESVAPAADSKASPLFSRPLVQSFEIARPYLFQGDTRGDSMWGRDYVTWALLAHDPSLEELARQAGTPLDSLRDQWFGFLKGEGDTHRQLEQWEEWRSKASQPPPSRSTGPITLLLTWNSKKYPWKELEKRIEEIAATGSATGFWSTGNRKDVQPGDRFFLLRQGEEPRGLVGKGSITGPVEERKRHWDETERNTGKSYLGAPVLWETLSRTPMIPLPDLIRHTGEKDLWNTQASGVEIKPDLAQRVQQRWDEAVAQAKKRQQETPSADRKATPEPPQNVSSEPDQTADINVEWLRPALALVETVKGTRGAVAFLVSPLLALTAAHAVRHLTSVKLHFPHWPAGGQEVEATIECLDPYGDYALLKLARPAPSEVKPLEPQIEVEPNTPWVACFSPLPEGTATPPTLSPGKGTVLELHHLKERIEGLPEQTGPRVLLDLNEETAGNTPRIGSSGTPICIGRRVAGMFAYGKQSPQRSWAIPISVPLNDPRIRQALHPGRDHSVPLLYTSVYAPTLAVSQTEQPLLDEIGSTLAQQESGLAIATDPVSLRIAQSYLAKCVLDRVEPHLVIQTPETPDPQAPLAGYVRPDLRSLEDLLSRSQLLLLFENWQRTLRPGARVDSRLILSNDPSLREVVQRIAEQWAQLPVPGLSLEEFTKLPDADTPSKITSISKVLKSWRAQHHLVAPSASPGFTSDAAVGTDCLNVEDQAKLFARVLVDSKFEPPLALGLFGEWGSGKSFFMDTLEECCKAASRQPGAERQISEEQQCHIRFNAWHYMDADLWAGLAGHIFEDLAVHLKDPQKSHQQARQKLRERLSSTREKRRDIDDAVATARNHVDEAQQQIQECAKKENEAKQKVNFLSSKFWDALSRETLAIKPAEAIKAVEVLGIDLGTDDKTEEKKEQARKAFLTAPEKVEETIANLKSVSATWRGVLGSLAGEPWAWIVGAAIVALPPLLIQQFGNLDGSTTLIGQVAGLATVIASKLHPWLKSVENLGSFANSVREAGSRVMEQVEHDLTPQEKEALEAFRKAETEAKAAVARKESIEAEIEALKSQLAELDAGKLVYDFLLERSAEEGIYRSKEGIVSLIRRDLETLSSLLLQWKEDQPSTEVPEKADLSKLKEEDKAKLPIRRIFLYIDDLDRCPPARVVEVLQAVHLLLAFDLFVVVVGVDARWLERSLETQYRRLIAPSAATARDGEFVTSTATARDYLEKIFQVPYALARVEPEGFRKLVKHHIKARPSWRDPLEEDSDKERNQPGRSAGQSPASPGNGGPPPVQPSPPKGNGGPPALPEHSKPSSPEQTSPATPTPGTPLPAEGGEVTPGSPAKAPAEPTPIEAYLIESWEQTFMATRLHPFIATPRLVKRFVNVYRLLRAEVSNDRYREFVQDRPGAPYRSLQVLLALNTGYPRLAGSLLAQLSRLSRPTGFPLLPVPSSFQQWVEQLKPNSNSELLQNLELQPAQNLELTTVHPILASLTHEVPVSMETWIYWAPKVGRYSIYWQGR